MSWNDLFSLATIISQTGFAVAAWRLANKINIRLVAHEQKDEVFHEEVRTKLGIPAPAHA